jgi:hypothetical protein
MSNQLTIIREPRTGLEWLYVNDKYVTFGVPILYKQWLSVIKEYKNFEVVKSFELTEQFKERVDCNYHLVPLKLGEFQDGDLKEV